VNFLFVGASRQQEDRGSHQAGGSVQRKHRRVLPLHLRRAIRCGAALIIRIRALMAEFRLLKRPLSVHRRGFPTEELTLTTWQRPSTSPEWNTEGFCVPLVERMARRARARLSPPLSGHAHGGRCPVCAEISSMPSNCSPLAFDDGLRADVIDGHAGARGFRRRAHHARSRRPGRQLS